MIKFSKKTIAILVSLSLILTMSSSVFAGSSKPFKELRPGNFAAKSYSSSKVRLTWNKVSDADGYRIYRAASKGGKYYLQESLRGEKTLKYINTECETGKTYYYKVRAYRKSKGKTVFSKYSQVRSAKPMPSKVSKIKYDYPAPDSDTYKIQWKKISGATGYQVKIREKGDKTWSGSVTVNEETQSFALDNNSAEIKLDKKKSYEIKVRAYRTENDRTFYGRYSDIKEIESPERYVTTDYVYNHKFIAVRSKALVYGVQGKPGPVLEIIIEDNDDRDYILTTDTIKVNGKTMKTDIKRKIFSGKIVIEKFQLDDKVLADKGIDVIKNIEFSFDVRNTSGKLLYTTKPIRINTLAEN